MITKVVVPGDAGNEFDLDSEGRLKEWREILYEIDGISEPLNGKRVLVRESRVKLKIARMTPKAISLPVRSTRALHPLE